MSFRNKVFEGITFHNDTPDKLCEVLSRLVDGSQTRVKIYCGDLDTGKAWIEEHDSIGYVALSTGQNRIPILLKTKASRGGGAICDHRILAIKDVHTGRFLYRTDNFKPPVVNIEDNDEFGLPYVTIIYGEVYGKHKNMEDAKRCQQLVNPKG